MVTAPGDKNANPMVVSNMADHIKTKQKRAVPCWHSYQESTANTVKLDNRWKKSACRKMAVTIW